MIRGLLDSGALPTVERLVQFTGERHRVLANNIANLDTPYFKPRDMNPKEFQAEMARAISERRKRAMPLGGPLDVKDTRHIDFHADSVKSNAGFANDNILFHDNNNRDLEITMKDLAENTLAHNAGVQMLKNQFDMLKTAIRERV